MAPASATSSTDDATYGLSDQEIDSIVSNALNGIDWNKVFSHLFDGSPSDDQTGGGICEMASVYVDTGPCTPDQSAASDKQIASLLSDASDASALAFSICMADFANPYCGSAETLADTLGAGAHGLDDIAAETAGTGGAAAVRVGQAGEAAVRGAYDIGPKATIQINGRTRILDGLNDTAVTEVKNVGYQAYTQQLRDSLAYAQQTGRQFDLYVRGSTTLSGPLQDAITSGQINLRLIP